MSVNKEQLLKIVRAAMVAAKAIVAVTPNVTDDRVYEIAEVIVNQVLGIFADAGPALNVDEEAAVELAVYQIKAACACDNENCDC